MQWMDRLHESLQYIEQNLDKEISYTKAASIACCSTYHYVRMFSYISGIPLSEYIRRRRMTKAAFDLQRGEKVLDVALRYGYDSPTAFNRAFKQIHHIVPSAARKRGVILTSYNTITFSMAIKGDVEMEYRIIEKETFRIVGLALTLEKHVEESFQKVPQFWHKVASEGKIPEIMALMESQTLPGLLGLCDCRDTIDTWNYLIAVASESDLPEGFSAYQVPKQTWAVFSGEGTMPYAIQELQKRIVSEWLPSSGYEYGDAPDIEVYLNDDVQHQKFEVWVPIEKGTTL